MLLVEVPGKIVDPEHQDKQKRHDDRALKQGRAFFVTPQRRHAAYAHQLLLGING
jgi:hypothetical protein